jgi:DNA polymerase-3 subunit delta
MGADRKVITVTGLNLSTLRAADLDKLCEALAEIPDYPYNLVILSAAADTFDPGNLPKKPSELLTTLGEYLTPVYFERNTPAKLAGWVQKHYLHGGVQADPKLCQFTIEYCGRNMFTLANEVDKVACYIRAHGRDTLTEADIRTAAIPAMEYDAFAFTNAIMERRRADALDILADLKLRRVEPLFILSEVSRVVCDLLAIRAMADGGRTAAEIGSELKMHEYRVGLYLKQARKTDLALLRNAVTAAEAADRALKRSAADGYGVIERLICAL